VEGLRDATKTLSLNSRYSYHDSKWAPLDTNKNGGIITDFMMDLTFQFAYYVGKIGVNQNGEFGLAVFS
jgi:hypothetical protein